MPRQFKHLDLTDFEVKFSDAGVATIEGYASTFGNVDNQNDVVVPGAFKNSIARELPRMLYQHQTDRIPGIWERAAEDSKGLIVQGRTLDTTLGRDAAEEVRSGAIKSMSIGYGTKKARFDRTKEVRYLEQVDLWEVSLVTFPANDQASITLVKSIDADIDAAAELVGEALTLCADGGPVPQEKCAVLLDLLNRASGLLEDPDGDDGEGKSLSPKHIERILREAGMSRGDARGVLAKGFQAIAPRREAAAPSLDTLLNILSNTNG